MDLQVRVLANWCLRASGGLRANGVPRISRDLPPPSSNRGSISYEPPTFRGDFAVSERCASAGKRERENGPSAEPKS